MSSQYFNIVDRFCRKYRVSTIDFIKLLMIYPFYKIIWFYLIDAKDFVGRLFKSLVTLIPSFILHVRVNPSNQLSFVLPISINPPDFDSFKEIFWGETYPLIDQVRSCKSLVDVGANTGMFSLYCLANLQLDQITLVEANPQLCAVLEQQFLGGDFSKITMKVINACVARESDQKIFFKVEKNHRNSKIVSDQDKYTHILSTISFISLPKADILKMDIEGEEINLINHCSHKFGEYRIIYLELHGSDEIRQQAKDHLTKIGFSSHLVTAVDQGCEVVAFYKD